MKCKDCPLFYETCSVSEDGTEYDVECAAGTYFGADTPFDWDIGGCKRTNKWILAQSKDDLLNKRWEKESDDLDRYMNELIACDDCKQKFPRHELRFEKGNWRDKNQCWDCHEKEKQAHPRHNPLP